MSTTLVFLFIFVMMIFCGGLSYRFIGRVCLFAVPVIGFLVWYIQQPFQILLHGYQLNRILAFLNPSEYQQTTANQQYNSVMAIGSGMLTGKGLNNNTITSVKGGNFISEQQTDFIFSVIGEELGFIGSCVTIPVSYTHLDVYKRQDGCILLFSEDYSPGSDLHVDSGCFSVSDNQLDK